MVGIYGDFHDDKTPKPVALNETRPMLQPAADRKIPRPWRTTPVFRVLPYTSLPTARRRCLTPPNNCPVGWVPLVDDDVNRCWRTRRFDRWSSQLTYATLLPPPPWSCWTLDSTPRGAHPQPQRLNTAEPGYACCPTVPVPRWAMTRRYRRNAPTNGDPLFAPRSGERLQHRVARPPPHLHSDVVGTGDFGRSRSTYQTTNIDSIQHGSKLPL